MCRAWVQVYRDPAKLALARASELRGKAPDLARILAIGDAVRARGLRVETPNMLVAHIGDERLLAAAFLTSARAATLDGAGAFASVVAGSF